MVVKTGLQPITIVVVTLAVAVGSPSARQLAVAPLEGSVEVPGARLFYLDGGGSGSAWSCSTPAPAARASGSTSGRRSAPPATG